MSTIVQKLNNILISRKHVLNYGHVLIDFDNRKAIEAGSNRSVQKRNRPLSSLGSDKNRPTRKL